MNNDTKLCPYCKEEIKADAIKCKHCGSMLTDAPDGGMPSDPETPVRNALASRFEIISEIGRGGMAVVYKAKQRNLGRIVALKVLPQQFTHDKEFLDRFHREARAAAQLSHPNIVTIYDEGVENGVHFISMEYLDGVDLHTLIRQKAKLSVEEAVGIVVPIAEALGYAHERGVVHRDVKSSNIKVTGTGRPVLMDFGIAHAASGTKLTRTGTVIGTPEYMSPEQAEGKEPDGRSDIYSLGVVLYEALTGRVPFTGDNPISVVNKVINAQPTQVRQLSANAPDWIGSIVERCLAKRPEGRYQSATDLAKELALDKSLDKGQRATETVRVSHSASGVGSQLRPLQRSVPQRRLLRLVIFALAACMVVTLIILAGRILGHNPISVSSDATIARYVGARLQIVFSAQEVAAFDKEINSYKILLESSPHNSILYNNLGVSYYQEGNLDSALAEFRKAIAVEPRNSMAWTNMGVAWEDGGDTVTAISCWRKAIDLDPKNARPYNCLGQIFLDRGQFDEATPLFKKAFEIDPDYSNAFNNLGVVFRDKGEFDSAKTLLGKAIDLDPKNPLPYLNLGLLSLSKHDTDEAIEFFNKAIKVKPMYPLSYGMLGDVYTARKNLDKAKAFYKDLVILDPKNLNALCAFGVVCELKGQFKEAISSFERAMNLNPKSAMPWHDLGRLYLENKEFQNAIGPYERAIELDPQNPWNYSDLANVYFGLGNLGKQIELYKEAATRGGSAAQEWLLAHGLDWPEVHPRDGSRRMVIDGLKNVAYDATSYYRKPVGLGGGGQSYRPQNDYWIAGFDRVTGQKTTLNGRYFITGGFQFATATWSDPCSAHPPSTTGESLNFIYIIGVGTAIGNDGKHPVEVVAEFKNDELLSLSILN